MAIDRSLAARLARGATAGDGVTIDVSKLLEQALVQIADDLYRRLRDELLTEMRAEQQRQQGVAQAVAAAIKQVVSPVVHVDTKPPEVTVPTHVEVQPADVVIPPAPAPVVNVENPKRITIHRDSDNQITGAEIS